jgi:alpha-beta hydrolase superfamily lysophospholipase
VSETPGGPRRFRDQRWLVDETIRTQTIEFDQPRLAYHLGPVGDELAPADMAVIRNAVKKLADHVPVVRGVAQRRERFARTADDAGHLQTAAVHWYAAAQLWSLACWPVWDDEALLHDLDDRKNAAYLAWAAHADHIVERLDIPFGDGALAAWFHVPAGTNGPLPTVLACGGMDAPREVVVARAGDPWMARGFAVLAVDGPGQGETAIRGVHVTPTAWIDAGQALVDWLRARPEVDAERLVCAGTSFGSHWMSQVAATQPVFRGCSVALPVFEPGARTIFEQAAPTFKARHMWMAGLFHDEKAFDELAEGYDLRPLVAGMQVPWQLVGGAADELSPTEWVDELAGACPAPVSVTRYAGARHSMTESLAAAVGPSWRGLTVDWLHDRILDRPAEDEHRLVTPAGEVVDLPHPRRG